MITCFNKFKKIFQDQPHKLITLESQALRLSLKALETISPTILTLQIDFVRNIRIVIEMNKYTRISQLILSESIIAISNKLLSLPAIHLRH